MRAARGGEGVLPAVLVTRDKKGGRTSCAPAQPGCSEPFVGTRAQARTGGVEIFRGKGIKIQTLSNLL